MNEQSLREAIETALQRHRALHTSPPASAGHSSGHAHPSHTRFAVVRTPAEHGDRCLIEPAVRCIQCGYCESYGH